MAFPDILRSRTVMAAVALAAGLGAWHGGRWAGGEFARSEARGEVDAVQFAAAVARQAAIRGPASVDTETRLEKVIPNGAELRYLLTVRFGADQIERMGMKATLAPRAQRRLCRGKDTSILLQKGVRFIQEYRDRDGKPVQEVAVTAADCLALAAEEPVKR